MARTNFSRISVVGLLRECVVKRGGTTRVLYQRAREKGEERENRLRANKIRRDTALRHRRRESDTDTERRECTKIYINEMTNNTQLPIMRRGVGYNRTSRRTDVGACSLMHRRGYRMEVLPEAHRRSSEQREPPRKPAHQKAMDLGRKAEREASEFCLTALRPLYARYILSLLVSLLL